jgi:hypothetical protein
MRIRVLVVAIFLVGAALRLHHLTDFPERGRSADEYAWTWCGMTLLNEGVPRSWSWMPAYGGAFPVQTWHGAEYRIVKPWFDHPPLYPLYVGAFVRAAGMRQIFFVTERAMRMSSLPLFAATCFFLFLVARRMADATHATLALAFYAVAPVAVWNGRMAMAEALMLPVALAGWYALQRYGDTPPTGRVASARNGWLVAVGVAALLLPLTKVAALGFALFLFTAAVLRREHALALAVCVGAACGLGLYAAYGAHYNWRLFREVQENQASRFENFGGFYSMVFSPRAVGKAIMELPLILGFMTLLADLRDNRNVEMGLFGAAYAMTIAFMLPYNEYAWYALPLYPAMAFGLASFVVRAWRDASTGALWTWMLFSMTYLAWLACDAEALEPRKLRWWYLALAVLLPLVTRATVNRPRLWRAGFVGLVALQVLGDAVYSFRK